jgi:hypothetical protein
VNGNDANVCSNIATPCRTLGAGITQVDANGEVIVIDTGSFAGVTITKAVKITAPAGVVAFSGLPVVVNPGSGKSVVLRGLTLKAATVGTGIGIEHQSGVLFVENTVVDGWNQGIRTQSGAERLFVKASVVRNSTDRGILINGGFAAIDQSFVEFNGEAGIHFWGGSGRVSNTVLSGATFGGVSQEPPSVAMFERCSISNTFKGLLAAYGGVLRASANSVTANTYGLVNEAGTLQSYGNNALHGNVSGPTLGPIDGISMQ